MNDESKTRIELRCESVDNDAPQAGDLPPESGLVVSSGHC